MFNKYAEYEKRRRTYLACRGVLRIKQADTLSDAMAEANARGDAMAARYYRDRDYASRAAAARRGGSREGARHGEGLRMAGDAIGDALARANGKIGNSSIEGGFDNAGEWLGNRVRDLGEGAKAIAGAGGAYLSNLGHGAAQGAKGIARGLSAAGNKLYNWAGNGIGDFVSGFGDNPGSSAFGLATGLGLGYLGNKAGNNIADYFELADKDWRRKALKWGLAGLGGLGGFYAGRGFGKGFGKAFAPGKAPVDPRDEVPYKPTPKKPFGYVEQDEDMNDAPDDLYTGGKAYGATYHHSPKAKPVTNKTSSYSSIVDRLHNMINRK